MASSLPNAAAGSLAGRVPSSRRLDRRSLPVSGPVDDSLAADLAWLTYLANQLLSTLVLWLAGGPAVAFGIRGAR